ncbi:MAG: hypothetical protein GY806_14990 [Gammaproteobacteria bacterium]|nr:hypothetical protein [Gammaproteobacteria bacterium]
MYRDDDLHPDDEKRRQYLVNSLSLGALSLAPFNLAQAAWWGSTPEQLPEHKSIFSLKGDVRVNGLAAHLDTRINPGDIVETGSDSEVVFVVGSDSFIMRSHSKMQIEGSGFFVDALRLITGGLLSVFGRRKQNQPLTMLSTTATIGIRGTGVYMETEPDLTYFCTCYGEVGLSSSNNLDDSEIISTKHHEEPKYISNKPVGGTHIRKAPFINHTDIELKLLEAIVGREVPFGIKTDLYKGERREY